VRGDEDEGGRYVYTYGVEEEADRIGKKRKEKLKRIGESC
jgi:hypothetical protein